MSYGEGNNVFNSNNIKEITIVDLRSDTLTKPSQSMRQAMCNAEVGDDVLGEDPTVKELEEKAAVLMGKEAAIFVSSGTMGNLIAILNHCDVRGSEAYCGEESHVVLNEQGGAAQLGGVTLRTLPNNLDGTFDLKKLESKLRNKNNIHHPISKLVLVENTINGKILPLPWIKELVALAKKYDLKLHMDGARIWNVSVATNIPPKDIVENFDSVTFCLSKGLGAPVGSLLCGSTSFIAKARRVRKVLGGAMRQVGVLAAAGLVAIKETIPLLKDDHKRARLIAQSINELNSKIFNVDLASVQTNMLFININSDSISSQSFAQRLGEVQDNIEDDKIIIKAYALTNTSMRLVLYYQITDAMVEAAIRKIKYVIKKFDTSIS